MDPKVLVMMLAGVCAIAALCFLFLMVNIMLTSKPAAPVAPVETSDRGVWSNVAFQNRTQLMQRIVNIEDIQDNMKVKIKQLEELHNENIINNTSSGNSGIGLRGRYEDKSVSRVERIYDGEIISWCN